MKKKVKKMAFGGPSIFGPKTVAALKSAPAPTQSTSRASINSVPSFAVKPPGTAMSPQSVNSKLADATTLYTPQHYQQQNQLNQLPQGSGNGLQPASPSLVKAFQNFNQQRNMGAPTTTTPTGPQSATTNRMAGTMKKGGSVKASKMGKVKQAKPSMGSASSRGDGIAQRGKTKGRMV